VDENRTWGQHRGRCVDTRGMALAAGQLAAALEIPLEARVDAGALLDEPEAPEPEDGADEEEDEDDEPAESPLFAAAGEVLSPDPDGEPALSAEAAVVLATFLPSLRESLR
jgi:hypothetical protein